MSELAHVDIESGVSLFTGEGFCTVTAAAADDDTVLRGQLTPAEVRDMALAWLTAAEAAEHDAAVFAELGSLGLDDEVRAAFIRALRERRR